MKKVQKALKKKGKIIIPRMNEIIYMDVERKIRKFQVKGAPLLFEGGDLGNPATMLSAKKRNNLSF